MLGDHPILSLYLTHRSALVDYANAIVHCRAQAEDLVQDAWLRLYSHKQGLSEIRQPLSYLYRIVRNLALDTNRHISRAPDMAHEEAYEQRNPEQYVHYQHCLQRLEQTLAQLPARNRQVFYLNRLQGQTFKQISERLGISSSLAHQILNETLEHCLTRLDAL